MKTGEDTETGISAINLLLCCRIVCSSKRPQDFEVSCDKQDRKRSEPGNTMSSNKYASSGMDSNNDIPITSDDDNNKPTL